MRNREGANVSKGMASLARCQYGPRDYVPLWDISYNLVGWIVNPIPVGSSTHLTGRQSTPYLQGASIAKKRGSLPMQEDGACSNSVP